MADTITSTSYLNVEVKMYELASDSTLNTDTTAVATLKLPNPKNNLTESNIRNGMKEALCLNQDIQIYKYTDTKGTEYTTKYGSLYDDIQTAYTVNQTINNLDIGWDD